MNLPNLLHLTRSCAKWRSGALLVATLLACTPAGAAELRLSGPRGTIELSAPGDTLRYSVTGPNVAGATSYLWNVTASPSTWGGLPTNLSTTSPVLAFAAVAPASWDSVTFTVTFQGKSASRSSNVLSATWKVKRTLVALGPLVVDSSGTGPISLIVRPSTITVVAGQTQQLCAFWLFGSGHVAMRTADLSTCNTFYLGFTTAQRAVTPPEQNYVDALCDWPACLLGITPRSPDVNRGQRAS